MNRRIRRKKLAVLDTMIADCLRTYATRPRGAGYEEMSRDLLGIVIGLSINERLRLTPGPRRGWWCGVPSELIIHEADGRSLDARGTLQLFPPREAAEVVEMFRFRAQRTTRGWRHVLFTFESPVVASPRNDSPNPELI